MAYAFRFCLSSAPEGRNDGSGMVAHDIYAEYDTGEGWAVVPGRHKTVLVPSAPLLAALGGAQPVPAYKSALAANINTNATPITGWAPADLAALMAANDAAAEAATAADEFITVTLHQSYPVSFTI